MNRRSFIGSVLALGAAPALVRAESLMPMTRKIDWHHVSLPSWYAGDNVSCKLSHLGTLFLQIYEIDDRVIEKINQVVLVPSWRLDEYGRHMYVLGDRRNG